MTVVDQDLIDKLPRFDAFCGDDGDDTDLNALVAGGAKRIVLGIGAVLTGHLTLTASSGFIWSPFNLRAITLGAYTIYIQGSSWHLEGFTINGSAYPAIEVQSGDVITLHRLQLINSWHGILFDTTGKVYEKGDKAVAVITCKMNG